MNDVANTFAQGAAMFIVAVLLAGLMSLPVHTALHTAQSFDKDQERLPR